MVRQSGRFPARIILVQSMYVCWSLWASMRLKSVAREQWHGPKRYLAYHRSWSSVVTDCIPTSRWVETKLCACVRRDVGTFYFPLHRWLTDRNCRRPSTVVNLNCVTNRVAPGSRYKLSYDAEQYKTIKTLLNIPYLQPPHPTVRQEPIAWLSMHPCWRLSGEAARPGELLAFCMQVRSRAMPSLLGIWLGLRGYGYLFEGLVS